MHSALPLLVALTLAGALLARRWQLAWCVAALCLGALVLLAPALLLAPDGIPGPVRLLGQVEPWAGSMPAGGNPHARDVVFQIEPWLTFSRAELRAGRLPLWNPYQSAGTPFWANGQSAVLFPLHLLVVVLPLDVALVVLAWARVVLAGLGVLVLARCLGMTRVASLCAALAWSLGGRMAAFLLYPMASSLALLPWTLWALERIGRGDRRGIAWLALASGLQLLGGHPETAVHGGLAGLIWLLARNEGWRRLPAATFGWGLGICLAAVQVVPLLRYLPQTARWRAATGGTALGLEELLPIWARLVLPGALGSPLDGSWFGPFNEVATAGFLGALVFPLVLIALLATHRESTTRRLVLISAVAGAIGYSLPGIHSLHALAPVLGRGLAHSSLPVFHLGLVLLAGVGLDRWRAGALRSAWGALAAAALVLVVLALWLEPRWSAHGVEMALRLGATAGGLLLIAFTPRSARARVGGALVAAVSLDLALVHGRTLGAGRLSELAPPTPETAAVRELAGSDYRVAGVGEALRPNTATVLGLRDVRGDDTLELAAFDALWNQFAGEHAAFFTPIENWDHPALDALCVRTVLGAPNQPAPASGWFLVLDGAGARVWERPGALPLVRLEPAAAGTVEVLDSQPGWWKLRWSTRQPASLVVAEMAAPGWRATNGVLGSTDLGLLEVPLAAGAGEVELRYRPPGLLLGALLSVLAVLGLIGLVLNGRVEGPFPRRRAPQRELVS